MNEYLSWLDRETQGVWWHDSAVPAEVTEALESGAKGITVNPVLVSKTLVDCPDYWAPMLKDIPANLSKADRTDEIIRRVTCHTAERFLPIYEESKGEWGYVCAQVNPNKFTDTAFMVEAAKKLSSWAKNISVKLPMTKAGLDALEECAALGIPVVGTVSFTLPQIMQIEKRYQAGIARAKAAGIKPARCFAVVMVGRIDDYIREVVQEAGMYNTTVMESDITQIGNAIMKRALKIWQENNHQSVLMPAGMRGPYHAQALAGAPMAFSIHPKIQKPLKATEKPYGLHIDEPIAEDVLERLSKVSEFVRAYEPDGMKPEEFVRYGVVQKTLAQFIAAWSVIEEYKI